MNRGFPRRAEFIWRPRGLQRVSFTAAPPRLADEANRFMYFRRSFELGALPLTALVHATADGRYQLFVNSRRIARGPVRSGAAYRQLDPIELAPHLQVGRNTIAVLAHAYGRNNAWYELPSWDYARAYGCGGFLLQGDLLADGQTLCLDTSAQWRCHEPAAWRRDVPANSLGGSEVYDARLALPWTEPDFDDSAWPAAEVLRVPGRAYTGDVRPFQYLTLRDIPAQREGPHVAARPVAWFEVESGQPGPDVAARMSAEARQALPLCTVSANMGTVRTTGARAVSLVYDFGEVVAGRIGFELDGPAGAALDFYPGEQLLPDGRVRIFDGIAGYDAQIAHRYVLREGAQAWERFEWNGLRYLQVTCRDCPQPLRILAVTVNQTGYPVQPRGAFECSDPLLNRIWHAGALTLARCMHDAYIDCPSREQRQWMDAYVGARINYAAFGDTALAARLIRQIAESQRPEGLTMMAAPGDFALAGFTNIPDFCLYWVLMIGDYLAHADDPGIADEVYPAVARALQWFERQLDEDDLLGNVPMWVFVDWAETDKQGQVTALNALYVAALGVAADLGRLVEHARAAARYDELRRRVCSAINQHLWDEARGVYVDARRGGVRGRRTSQQSNAAAIAFGVAPADRHARIWATVLDDARLVLTHALGAEGKVTPFDEAFNVVLAQPFYGHFLHRALRISGRTQRLVEHMRQRWGAMLADGAATLRESWQLDPITSLCHAWSGTPTFDLSTDVLGVASLGAGCRRLRVAPHLADLCWARGAFPTPHGELRVAWSQEGERFAIEVDVPSGCEAEIVCPAAYAWVRPATGAPSPGTLLAGAGWHTLTARLSAPPP